MAVLAPPAMLARWDTAVGLDTEGARDLPSRQRTLRSAFDWSYDLLEPGEQTLLRRLAAFPDGFGVPAVEAAQRGDDGVLAPLDLDPIATLAGLVDRSLLYREAGPAAEPRFSLLATVAPTCASASPTKGRKRPRTCGWRGSAQRPRMTTAAASR